MQLLSAQTGDTVLAGKQFPVEISFFNHAVSMPFDGIILKPVHPGFSLGTEYPFITRKEGTLYQALHGGFFYNKYVAKALFLETEIGYRYTFRPGFFANIEIGVGYLHSFHPVKKIFALNNGVYEEVKDYGKPAFTVSLGFGAGYDFSIKTDWPVSVFLKYEPFIQTPYSMESGIYPHLKQHIGLRFFLR